MTGTFTTKNYLVAGVTDVGLVREHNEDTILMDSELGLLLVADGMGGHKAGEVASQEAVQCIRQYIGQLHQPVTDKKLSLAGKIKNFFIRRSDAQNASASRKKQDETEQLIVDVIKETNQHLYQLNSSRFGRGDVGMGTTLAGCLLVETDLLAIFHVGDSRVYRSSEGKLRQLTIDHSMLQDWKDSGCLGDRPRSNVIYKALGPYEDVQPDVGFIRIKQDDVFLLCSDGLSDKVSDQDIQTVLSSVAADNIESCTEQLVQKALDAGGQDNISLIVFFVQGEINPS